MRCSAKRERSGASLIRDLRNFRICNGPRSAAQCFTLLCARNTHVGDNLMLAPSPEPTVASVFAPRTTIDADGTVEGYASLFGELCRRRTAAKDT
jgi:hypothetical protein